MKEYPKIDSVFKRNQQTGAFIIGQYSTPEFEYLKDNKWVWTEKVDGTNIRIKWENKQLSFGGKTDNAQMPVFLFDKLKTMFNEEAMLASFTSTDVCLYGEGFGNRIQKGAKYIKDDVSFVLFDIQIGFWWLKREDMIPIADQLKLSMVPIVGSGTLAEALVFAKQGFKSAWGDFMAEGIVLRPEVELKDRAGRRIITKLKMVDFTK